VEAVKLGRFRISLEGLGLAVLALALVLSVQRCAGIQEGKQAERLAQLERNAHKASLSSIRSRAVTDSVTRASDAEKRRLARVAANVRKANDSLRSALDSAEAVLAEMPDSAVYVHPYVQRLHASLSIVTERARTLHDSTDVLLGGIDRLLAAQEAERQAWLAERAENAKLIAAERQVSEHLRKQARCRVLGVPCLTRVQSGMVGAGSILLLLTLL
jgi:type IV secretory pathway VirJ component